MKPGKPKDIIDSEFKVMQQELGCEGCKFCNPDLLWKAGCCTIRLYSDDIDPETGRCLRRKD